MAVSLGVADTVQPVLESGSRILVEKRVLNQITTSLRLTEGVEAPVEEGQKLGELVVSAGDVQLQTIPLVAHQAVARITVPGLFLRLVRTLFLAG